MDERRVIDLQMFAEPGGEGAGGAAPTQGGSTAPAQGGGQPPAQGQGGDQPPGASGPQLLDFGGRKVPVVDPSLQDLHQDWVEQTRTLQRYREEAEQYKQEAEQYRQMIGQLLNHPVQPAAHEPSPEELSQRRQEWLDRFYERGPDAVAELVQQELEAYRRREQEERRRSQEAWNAAVQTMRETYPDFDQYTQQLGQYIEQHPDEIRDPRDLELAYLKIRSQSMPAFNPNDPQAAQRIMTDPAYQSLRDAVIQSYLASKNKQQSGSPPVLGGGAGYGAPQLPENTPKTLREASALLRRDLGLIGSGG